MESPKTVDALVLWLRAHLIVPVPKAANLLEHLVGHVSRVPFGNVPVKFLQLKIVGPRWPGVQASKTSLQILDCRIR